MAWRVQAFTPDTTRLVQEMSAAIRDDDAARAPSRVLEGAVNLAKAEGRLALSQLRAVLQKALLAAGLLWTAASALHVAIALICTSPLLVTIWDPRIVLLSIAVSVGTGVVLGVIGARRLRAAFTPPEAAPALGPHEISVLPHGMHRGGT